MIPFEEKELLALFGDQYARYVDGVPMLFPFTKGEKRPNHG
jgi:protein-S-isoprenylcysteine O-methyltransferase Ste14